MSLFALQWGMPKAFYLLPLVILPWLSKNTYKTIVSTSFIPSDPLSDFMGYLLKGLASMVLICLVLILAKPYYPEQLVQRMGSGAEIVILVDRSRSMDEPFTSRKDAVAGSRTVGKANSKRRIANKHLVEFIDKRPDDRFGFILFSNKALALLSLSSNHDSVKAVINASSLGKGLSETNIALALIKAAEMYAGEDYHGSRAVLLVSDGGQQLSSEEKRVIRDVFQHEQITLYWLYMGDRKGVINDVSQPELPITPDKQLHDFFKTLTTPYIGFEIDTINTFLNILETINNQQQEALMIDEVIPRKPMSAPLLWLAILASLILLLSNMVTLWGVKKSSR